ncbi:SHOCT domain-containing protein [Streptomyces sp. NPDC000987]|uniref:SHOCT domain-containing protein n=1 Tax=unclassified Streptomyces TaxID=2593676 RepID=UPI002D7A4069|nr:SHOCT domain-containing protein [Streptomyces sp. H51]
MYWNRHGMSGWTWSAGSVGMVLMWALLIVVAVVVYRVVSRTPKPPHPPARTSPEQLLAERFARGEIDEEEYRRRLSVLRADGPTLSKH